MHRSGTNCFIVGSGIRCYNRVHQHCRQKKLCKSFPIRVKTNRENACLVSETQNETEGTAWRFKFKRPKDKWARLKIGVAGSSGSGKT